MWKQKIEKPLQLILNCGTFHIGKLCFSRLLRYTENWWRQRQYDVEIGRKPIILKWH